MVSTEGGQSCASVLRALTSQSNGSPTAAKVTYWYAWRGGPLLRGEPGTPESVASYNEAVAQKLTPPRGTLLGLLHEYQAATDFLSLAERTRKDYIAQIKIIEAEFSDFPLSALSDRQSRGVFMAWRDQLALKSRRQADYAWTVLARVLSWAMNRGRITANPCHKIFLRDIENAAQLLGSKLVTFSIAQPE